MDDSHGDLSIPNAVIDIASSFVDEVGEFRKSGDKLPDAIIVIDFRIMVILSCVVLSENVYESGVCRSHMSYGLGLHLRPS